MTNKLYIGSMVPFNHRYFSVASGGNASAVISIKYWDGEQFRACVDIDDQTIGLSQSGNILWVPNKQYGWIRDDTVDSNGSARISELSSKTLYGYYWLELGADLDITVTLNWIAHLFSQSDEDLRPYYSDLLRANVLTSLGWSDYEGARIAATETIILKLKTRGDILTPDNILSPEELRLVTVHQTASVIYGNLGDDYADDKKAAEDTVGKLLSPKTFKQDTNNNARLDPKELQVTSVELYR